MELHDVTDTLEYSRRFWGSSGVRWTSIRRTEELVAGSCCRNRAASWIAFSWFLGFEQFPKNSHCQLLVQRRYRRKEAESALVE